jgi:hypothetical protein
MGAAKAGDPAEFSGGSACGNVNNAQAAVRLFPWTGSCWSSIGNTFYVAFF